MACWHYEVKLCNIVMEAFSILIIILAIHNSKTQSVNGDFLVTNIKSALQPDNYKEVKASGILSSDSKYLKGV